LVKLVELVKFINYIYLI